MSRTELYSNTLMRVYGPEGGTLKFLPVSPSGYGATRRVSFRPSRRSGSFGYYENPDGSKTYVNPDGTTTTVPVGFTRDSSGATKSKVSGEQVASTVQSVAEAITGLVGAFKKPQTPTYVPAPAASTVPWGWIIGGVAGVVVLGIGAYVLTRPAAPAAGAA
jgi:hypothetical protein